MTGFTLPLGLGALVALSLAAPTSWSATLTPAERSRVSGMARVEALGTDSTRAILRLAGGKPGSALAWHVHAGGCGAKGAILGATALYPAITVGGDGTAYAVATLPSSPPERGEYSVTVHASTTDMTPVACGTLKPDAATPAPQPRDSAAMRP